MHNQEKKAKSHEPIHKQVSKKLFTLAQGKNMEKLPKKKMTKGGFPCACTME